MILVDYVAELMQARRSADEAIKEFWEPTRQWSFLEFLAPTFTVVRVVKQRELNKAAGYAVMFLVGNDRKLAERTWPCTGSP
jgi:hypothetical protein